MKSSSRGGGGGGPAGLLSLHEDSHSPSSRCCLLALGDGNSLLAHTRAHMHQIQCKYSKNMEVSSSQSETYTRKSTLCKEFRLNSSCLLVLVVVATLFLCVPLVGAKEEVPPVLLNGLPDAVATVGHWFEYTIPGDAFSGDVEHYEISALGADSLPDWLTFDDITSTLKGIPLPGAERTWLLQVRAYSSVSSYNDEDEYADDVLQLQVVSQQKGTKSEKHALSMFGGGGSWGDSHKLSKENEKKGSKENHLVKTRIGSVECQKNTKRLWASLIPSVKFLSLSGDNRIEILKKVGEFFGISSHTLSVIGPLSARIVHQSRPSQLTADNTSNVIAFPFGCGHFDPKSDNTASVIRQLDLCLQSCRYSSSHPNTALTIAEWFISSEPPHKATQEHRAKRAAPVAPDNSQPDVFFVFTSAVTEDIFSSVFPSFSSTQPSIGVETSSDTRTSTTSSSSIAPVTTVESSSSPASVEPTPLSFLSSSTLAGVQSSSTPIVETPRSRMVPTSMATIEFSDTSSTTSMGMFTFSPTSSFEPDSSSDEEESSESTLLIITSSFEIPPTRVVPTSAITAQVESSMFSSLSSTFMIFMMSDVEETSSSVEDMQTSESTSIEETPVFSSSDFFASSSMLTGIFVSSQVFVPEFPSLTSSSVAATSVDETSRFFLSDTLTPEPTPTLSSVAVSESSIESGISDSIEPTLTSEALLATTPMTEISSIDQMLTSLVEDTPSVSLPTSVVSSVVTVSSSIVSISFEDTPTLDLSTLLASSQTPSTSVVVTPAVSTLVEETPSPGVTTTLVLSGDISTSTFVSATPEPTRSLVPATSTVLFVEESSSVFVPVSREQTTVTLFEPTTTVVTSVESLSTPVPSISVEDTPSLSVFSMLSSLDIVPTIDSSTPFEVTPSFSASPSVPSSPETVPMVDSSTPFELSPSFTSTSAFSSETPVISSSVTSVLATDTTPSISSVETSSTETSDAVSETPLPPTTFVLSVPASSSSTIIEETPSFTAVTSILSTSVPLPSTPVVSSPLVEPPETTPVSFSTVQSVFSETESSTVLFSPSISSVLSVTIPDEPTLVVTPSSTTLATTEFFPTSVLTTVQSLSSSPEILSPVSSDSVTPSSMEVGMTSSSQFAETTSSPFSVPPSLTSLSSFESVSFSSFVFPTTTSASISVVDSVISTTIASSSIFEAPSSSLISLFSPPPPTPTISPTPPPPPNAPPILVNPIGLVNIQEGQAFVFNIPENTFSDREDGLTSNLTLSLVNDEGTRDFTWVELKRLQLQGVAFFPVTDITVVTEFVFVLLAVDSGGEYTWDFVTFQVTPTENPGFNLTITVEGDFATFQRNLSRQIELAGLLSTAHNLPLRDIIFITYAEGSIILTYSSPSVSSFDCVAQSKWVTTVATINPDGTYSYTDSFRMIFGGIFVLVGNPVYSGRCKDDPTFGTTPPPTGELDTTAASDKDIVLFLAIMIPGIVLGLLVVIVTVLALVRYRARRGERRYLLEKRTFRNRRPVVFSDELEPRPRNRQNHPRLLEDEGPPGSIHSHVPDTLPPSADPEERRLLIPPPAYQELPDEYFSKYDDYEFDLELEDHT